VTIRTFQWNKSLLSRNHPKIIQCVPLVTETGWPADRCSVSQQLGALQTHSFSFLTQQTYSSSNFRCNIFIGVRIVKEMPGSVASGTHCKRLQLTLWKQRSSKKLPNAAL